MKNLLLMRHAKSDWNSGHSDDRARPLNRRGQRAAARMGQLIGSLEDSPEHVLCSTAVRTRETLTGALAAGAWEPSVEYADAIYAAAPAAILDCVRGLDETLDTVLVVGHEPGMSTTLSILLGEAPARFPTAAVVRLALDIERWSHLGAGTATLLWFVPPRLLDC